MSAAAIGIVESGATLQAQGRAFLAALYAALRSLKLYPLENAAAQNALAELHRISHRIVEREEAIELRLVGDFFFLNDARLRLDLTNFAAFSFLAGTLARHGIGIIDVLPEVEQEEWAPFLSTLLRDDAEEAPFERFVQRLGETRIAHILVDAGRDPGRELLDDEHAREAAKRTYFQSVHAIREVLTDARIGRAVNVRRVKRAVQAIVDQVLDNETVMVGMTALRDYDEYTFTHCVNVCILSIIIGQRLGFSKQQLYELGLGALFHDIGKTRVDREITNKAGPLSAEELAHIREHPTDGLLELFAVHGFSEMPYRAMLVAYEHHMKRDQSGYPRSVRPRDLTLFGRIVAVADGFDAGTSRRSYQPFPSTPDAVLREMRDNLKRGYDPVIVRALISATGVYPVGTVVILDTFEIGIVVEAANDPAALHQPRVRILADAMGARLAEPTTADLAELDSATGLPRRTVIKTIDPEKYGIHVGDYFL